jgi:hypothetical protein
MLMFDFFLVNLFAFGQECDLIWEIYEGNWVNFGRREAKKVLSVSLSPLSLSLALFLSP